MILIEAGERNERSHDAKVLFASQLTKRGYAVGIDDKSIPTDLDRSQKYEIAPFLVEMPQAGLSFVILIGAESIDTETLMQLRNYALEPEVAVWGIGRFSDLQTL
ncbi:MAG: hypothetical protein WBO29_00345, partial [Albidovulum sp.]